MSGFKKFLLRGNVVDLAVGVVVGAAFTGLVNALVKDLLTPLIAVVGGAPDFSAVSFTLNNSTFRIGDFINALVSFALVAFVVYYFVVLPVNTLVDRMKPAPADVAASPKTRECPHCLSKIPAAASRCAFCTSEVTPVP